MKVNYHISVTYRCDLKCKYCFQFFDRIPAMGEESDISVEEMRLGAEKLKGKGIEVGNFRLTGGEPLLHPEIELVHRAAVAYWKPNGWLRVYSSGMTGWKPDLEKLAGQKMKFAVKKPKKKKWIHIPIMVSPADLGMEPMLGFNERPCRIQAKCGRCFDAFGFSGCPNAPALGRLFNIGVHHAEPTMFTDPRLCKHCPHSLGQKEHVRLGQMVRDGVLEYPTDTYRWALKKWKQRKMVDADSPTRFRYRV